MIQCFRISLHAWALGIKIVFRYSWAMQAWTWIAHNPLHVYDPCIAWSLMHALHNLCIAWSVYVRMICHLMHYPRPACLGKATRVVCINESATLFKTERYSRMCHNNNPVPVRYHVHNMDKWWWIEPSPPFQTTTSNVPSTWRVTPSFTECISLHPIVRSRIQLNHTLALHWLSRWQR